jgi:hypothetical protein
MMWIGEDRQHPMQPNSRRRQATFNTTKQHSQQPPCKVELVSQALSFRPCRVQEHTLPKNETMYTRFYFPLPQDKDYYIVGFLANIVNKIHTHHYQVWFCTAGVDKLYSPPQEAGFAEQPTDDYDQGTLLLELSCVL